MLVVATAVFASLAVVLLLVGAIGLWRLRAARRAAERGRDIGSRSGGSEGSAARSGLQLRGRPARRSKLPPKFEPVYRAARAAAKDLKRARRALSDVEQRRQEALGSTETVRMGIEVSKARMAERQAATNSRFAYLVLGRELATVGLCPSGAEGDLEEAHELRQQLG